MGCLWTNDQKTSFRAPPSATTTALLPKLVPMIKPRIMQMTVMGHFPLASLRQLEAPAKVPGRTEESPVDPPGRRGFDSGHPSRGTWGRGGRRPNFDNVVNGQLFPCRKNKPSRGGAGLKSRRLSVDELPSGALLLECRSSAHRELVHENARHRGDQPQRNGPPVGWAGSMGEFFGRCLARAVTQKESPASNGVCSNYRLRSIDHGRLLRDRLGSIDPALQFKLLQYVRQLLVKVDHGVHRHC